MNIEKKLKYILPKINKPSRYIGKELGAIYKDFNLIDVNFALIFPDLYELGICNQGCRIIYDILNKLDYVWCQRTYAPDIDMKKEMEKYNLPLYSIESKTAIEKFDVVAFSLQYELAYPTILALLNMSNIKIKADERSKNDPIVLAGGPGAYNPLPVENFIDVFNIGDGEEALIEVCKFLKENKDKTREEKLEGISNIEGIYVPRFSKLVKKRTAPLDRNNALGDFPIPYSPCIHDRVVTEIRRGCGRMCRFCQSCFTNLPVREREPQEVIETTTKLLSNTGYEEYSLLSLSSNDYSNIESVVKSLCEIHSPSGASISLPSQRADSFSLNLAQMVQSVRKSTITFAPEAGSQRLRNVINKNLTQEQITEAVITCYKSGWGKVKLYFMLGLPTESFDDLDEMIKLLRSIKNEALSIKKELGLKHHLDLVCTISNFVPKPHTPFQWFGQDSPERLQEKINYLLQQKKGLRGVRLNFSDIFISQIEATLSRAGIELNSLIEKVYEKGAYLDAWDEHINKSLWVESANELGINLNNYSTKTLDISENLPWDFIKTGVKKEWLVSEYNKALKDSATIPCDEGCSACGVCQNTNYKKQTLERNSYKPALKHVKQKNEESYLYRLKVSKKDHLKYISHLDWLGTIYKALRRAKLDFVYSQGFNPAPKISSSVALPLFIESEGEYMDIEIYNHLTEEVLGEKINKALPEGAEALRVIKIAKNMPSIDKTIYWGKYTAKIVDKALVKNLELRYKLDELLNESEFFIEKTNKKGLTKKIDIRPSIKSISILDEQDGLIEFVIKTGQIDSENIKPLRADELLTSIFEQTDWEVVRKSLLDINLKELL